MRDLRLALMCGIDIPIPECTLTAHQPKLSEIAFIGETDYFIGIQCLCINQNMVQELADANVDLPQVSNFTFFMTMLQSPEMKDKKQCVIDVLSLIFANKRIAFTPNSLLFTDIKTNESSIVDENNFDVFQNVLKQIFCINRASDQSVLNPVNDKAKEIAKKIMRGRERVAAQKSKGGSEEESAFVKYISILTIGTNTMNIQNIINLTLYQLYDLIERYYLHLNWDMDAKTRLAGGDPKTQPDDWMKNIH